MLGRMLRLSLWIASALAVAIYLAYAVRALPGAQPRDVVEATVLEHSTHWAAGQSPYRDRAESLAAPLMPGLPLAASLLARFHSGAEAWQARLVCLLAVLVTAALVALLVRRETGNLTLGAASAGLVALAQLSSGVSRASAHPEPLMLMWVVAGAWALRAGSGATTAALAGAAMTAAALTHPLGLWFGFAGVAHLAWLDRRRLAGYLASFGALLAGCQITLSWGLGPWFNYAAWDRVAQLTRFDPFELMGFLGTDLLGTFGLLTLAMVLGFALPVRPWRGAGGLWTWLGLAAVLAGLLASQSTQTPGEALRPAAVLLALAGPVAMQRIAQHLSAWPGSSRVGGQQVVHVALALQFVALLAHVAPTVFLGRV